MGAKSGGGGGGGGARPRSQDISGGRPPEIMIFVTFLLTGITILHFQHFQNKVAEIREETNIGGR